MKIAMVQIQDRLIEGKYRSKLILQVHDEVVLDCPKDEARDARKLITEVMEGAMTLDVPLKVNSAQGDNWMDL
jgi:DNA polymerase-1